MSASATTICQPIDFEQSDSLRFLPEGPFDLGAEKLSWVGIQHGADSHQGSINVLDLKTGKNQSHVLPGRPGFAFPTTTDGIYVAGVERELGLFDTNDQSWKPFCRGIDEDVQNTIINDGVMHQHLLIFGTKDLEFATEKAGLYLYNSKTQRLVRLRDDQICSNGKAIVSADEEQVTFLDIDSPSRKIVRYKLDVASESLGQPETVVDLTDDPAVPDGQILTPNGESLIVAMFHPGVAEHGETRMYDVASGTLQHTWVTPASPQNTCPALVQSSGQVKLVITTAVENFDAKSLQACPNAGRLFIGETNLQSVGEASQQRWQI